MVGGSLEPDKGITHPYDIVAQISETIRPRRNRHGMTPLMRTARMAPRRRQKVVTAQVTGHSETAVGTRDDTELAPFIVLQLSILGAVVILVERGFLRCGWASDHDLRQDSAADAVPLRTNANRATRSRDSEEAVATLGRR